MRVHYLKTWPTFFSAVKAGEKPFELRKDDRLYDVGDILILQYWDPDVAAKDKSPSGGYTGEEIRGEVTYLLLANESGALVAGFCAMGVRWDLPAIPRNP